MIPCIYVKQLHLHFILLMTYSWKHNVFSKCNLFYIFNDAEMIDMPNTLDLIIVNINSLDDVFSF